MRNRLFSLFFLFTTLLISGCYEVPAPQGNPLTKTAISKIKPGMTSEQVITAVGDPIMSNAFANNEMNYIYSYKKVGDPLKVKRVIVSFQKNKVIKVDISGEDGIIAQL